MLTCAHCKTGDTVTLADRASCLNCGGHTGMDGKAIATREPHATQVGEQADAVLHATR